MKNNLKISGLILGLLIAHPVLAADTAWNIDPVHSNVEFSVKHMMASNVRGRFGKVSGDVQYDGQHPANATINATIAVASIDTNDAKRDGHLKSPDFFDLAKFPEIKFVSKQITQQGDDLKIKGDLTLHGVTMPVVLTADPISPVVHDPYGMNRVGTTARTKLNRKDFGIAFNQMLDNGGAIVGDIVDVSLDIELVQKKTASLPKSNNLANAGQ
jgi:polyisoprenoid-binding protein YceI